MRTHRIDRKIKKRQQCWECDKFVTLAQADEFCPGKMVSASKPKRRR